MISILKQFDYHKELIELLFKSNMAPLSSNFIMPILSYILFMDMIKHEVLFVWLSCHFIVFFLRMLTRKKVLANLNYFTSKEIKNYMIYYLSLVFLSASLWGVLFTFSFIYMNDVNQYITLAILLGLIAGSTTSLSSIFHASFVFISTIILFMIFNLLYFDSSLNHLVIVLLLLIYVYVVNSSNYKIYMLLVNSIEKNITILKSNKILELKAKEATDSANKKEELIQKQSALVQMGEMISMIAHQWRQPLGAIVAVSIDMKMQFELDTFDLEKKEKRDECKKYFSDALKDIDSLVQNMTNTIDDFRNFYKPNKEFSTTSISVPITKAIGIIRNSFKSEGISIIEEYESSNDVDIYVNEMMQVILNILKNAQDNFKEQDVSNKCIKFISKDLDDGILVEICDNGGGINNDLLSKIFNPYFSTKHEKNGTGLGLYMSKIIIEEHHLGRLSASNTEKGVCFSIILNKNFDEGLN